MGLKLRLFILITLASVLYILLASVVGYFHYKILVRRCGCDEFRQRCRIDFGPPHWFFPMLASILWPVVVTILLGLRLGGFLFDKERPGRVTRADRRHHREMERLQEERRLFEAQVKFLKENGVEIIRPD